MVRIPLSPFSKYKIPEVTVSVEHRVLSVEQIQRIIDLPYVYQNKNKGYSLFNIAKDVFLISFALMGMNTG